MQRSEKSSLFPFFEDLTRATVTRRRSGMDILTDQNVLLTGCIVQNVRCFDTLRAKFAMFLLIRGETHLNRALYAQLCYLSSLIITESAFKFVLRGLCPQISSEQRQNGVTPECAPTILQQNNDLQDNHSAKVWQGGMLWNYCNSWFMILGRLLLYSVSKETNIYSLLLPKSACTSASGLRLSTALNRCYRGCKT